MARTFTTRFAVALIALLACGLSDARAQFSITLDSVVAIDTAGTIRQYNPTTGAVTGTRTTTDLGPVTGLTVLGNRVFVSNSGGNVYEVDPAGDGTGNLLFPAGNGNEGLGDNGVNLLSLNFSAMSGQVQEYAPIATSTPVVLSATTVGTNRTGVDGSGSRIFVADFTASGNILEFSQGGTTTVPVNTITTGLMSGVNSGLGYDPFDNTYWLATGNATGTGTFDDRILEFSPSGAVLTNIVAVDIVGLDFVPVPEPGSCLAVAAAVLGLGAAARRRLRRSAATA